MKQTKSFFKKHGYLEIGSGYCKISFIISITFVNSKSTHHDSFVKIYFLLTMSDSQVSFKGQSCSCKQHFVNYYPDPKSNKYSSFTYILHLNPNCNPISILNALLHSIKGGVLIGNQCKIRSRAIIWSLFDLIERIKIKILCLFHKQIFFYPKNLWKLLFKTFKKIFWCFPSFDTKTYFTKKIFYFFRIF